jgi:hypothetical protein
VLVAIWLGAGCVLDDDLGDAPADGGLDGDGGDGDGGSAIDQCETGGELDLCGEIGGIEFAGQFVRVTYSALSSYSENEGGVVGSAQNRFWTHRSEPPTVESVLELNDGSQGAADNFDADQILSEATTWSSGTAYVFRDPLGEIDEVDEDNNLASMEWTRDQAVLQIPGSPIPSTTSLARGSSFTVTLSLSADVVRVRVRLINAADETDQQNPTTTMTTSGNSSVDVSVDTFGNISAGPSYYVGVMTDYGDSACCAGVFHVVADELASTYARHECENYGGDFVCQGDPNILETDLAVPWITVTP